MTTDEQREVILDILHEPGRPWMATPAIAAKTPWSCETVYSRLRTLRSHGLVERWQPKGWRLA